MEQLHPSRTALVTDGHAGNLRQARALAQAMGLADDAELQLQPGLLARWLAPRRWPLLHAPFGPAFRAECRSPPAIAIGCGRQAALATRLLRQAGSRVIQILDPRIDPRHWDLVIVPEHDRLRGGNVLSLLGSLHPVDDAWLAQARHADARLAGLPSPHVLLLVGGPTRHAPLDDAGFARLLADLQAQARASGGSLSLSASRRTPEGWKQAIAGMDPGVPGLRWRDPRDGPNPYASLLAQADRIVCTPDSVNMLSEAAATRVPLQAWAIERVHGRARAFLDALQARGRLQPFAAPWPDAPAEPLRETPRIAAEVLHRLAGT